MVIFTVAIIFIFIIVMIVIIIIAIFIFIVIFVVIIGVVYPSPGGGSQWEGGCRVPSGAICGDGCCAEEGGGGGGVHGSLWRTTVDSSTAAGR